ncbi:hypothetical protein AGMMS4956_17820 [Bacteroidia bacterium]|nr:hypothetical protein AGMMS4956_17820 [Bacteroidia bacterium]
MRKIGLIILLLWSGVLLAHAPKMSLQTQRMVTQHVDSQPTDKRSKSIAPAARRTVFVTIDSTFDPQSLQALDATIGIQTPTLLTVTLPIKNIEALTELQGVLFVNIGSKARPLLDKAIPDMGVDSVWNTSSTHPDTFYTGKGVVVGVIDYGLDITHPAFYKDDSTLKIKRVWVQDATGGTRPAGFTYGREYATTEDLLALQKSSVFESHGTHVSSIAVGTGGKLGKYRGVAPDADLVFVELSEDNYTTKIAEGIQYIFDYATSVNKPAVVNLSMGTHEGPHNGKSELDQMIDSKVGAGRIVVGAVGNEGATPLHAQHTFTPQNEEKRIAVTPIIPDANPSIKHGVCCAVMSSSKNFEWSVEIWDTKKEKNKHKTKFFLSAQNNGLKGPNDDGAGYKVTIDGETVEVWVRSYNPNTNYRLAYFDAVFETSSSSSLEVAFVFRASSGTLHVWNAHNSTLTKGIGASWLTPDHNCTAGEIGGTARKIISVGAYNIRSDNGGELDSKSRTMASFSSRGPTADGRTKPDIAAPGSWIYSAINSFHNYSNLNQNEPAPDHHQYAMMQGTSMASPMIAGVVALMLQARPTLTPDTIKGLLGKYANLDALNGINANRRGYGKVNANATLSNINDTDIPLLVIAKKNNAEEAVFSIVPNPNKGTFALHFSQAEQGEMRLYNLMGTLLYSQPILSHQTITLPLLPKGIYVVNLLINNKLSAQKMVIW